MNLPHFSFLDEDYNYTEIKSVVLIGLKLEELQNVRNQFLKGEWLHSFYIWIISNSLSNLGQHIQVEQRKYQAWFSSSREIMTSWEKGKV